MTIEEEREAVVAEARGWIGTPYHHGAHVKHAGASCAWLIAEVYNRAIKTEFSVIEYPEQWFLNSKTELYFDGLRAQGFVETTEKDKANIIISRLIYNLYCHGGIITKWPSVIHTSTRGTQEVKSAYSSWFFGQNPDTLKFLVWKGWNAR